MIGAITGIGWVTASGMGRGRAGNSETDESYILTQGELPKLTRKSVFKEPYKHFGRMDQFSKLGLAAVAFALMDAGLDQWTEKRDIGIIASTVYGCLNTDLDYFNTVLPDEGLLASPNLFAYTLPNCFLGEAAIRFGITGTSYVINEQSNNGLGSVRVALESILSKEADKMLCGFCDLGSSSKKIKDSDVEPGAVFFVIEKSPDSDYEPYGEIDIQQKKIMINELEVNSLNNLTRACMKRV